MTGPRQPTEPAPGSGKPDDAPPAIARAYLTIEQLAAHTGFSVSTLRRLRKKGLLRGHQPGGPGTRIVFPPDAIEVLPKDVPEDVPTSHADSGPANAPQRGPWPRWMEGQ